MLEAGGAIALATDFNPGTCPTESMQIVQTMAWQVLGLTPAQALAASTINSAHAIGVANEVGSLEVGKAADFVIYDEQGNLKHVLDIKNSFKAPYGIDTAASNRFKLFAKKYQIPVEVIVPRTHDFRMKVVGTTKKFEPIILDDLGYDLRAVIESHYE